MDDRINAVVAVFAARTPDLKVSLSSFFNVFFGIVLHTNSTYLWYTILYFCQRECMHQILVVEDDRNTY